MTRWERARVAITCGGPHDEPTRIQPGEPVLFVMTGARRLYRCQRCAGPAPALPPLDTVDPSIRLRELLETLPPLEDPPTPEPEDW